MATITAQMVKDLRVRTDLPMMECKTALSENNGDIESAIEWLRKKHKGKLEERADRITGEGRIGIFIDDSKKTGAIVEMQCETAPVASNELFINLADAFAAKVASGSDAKPDPEAILKDPSMETAFTEVFGKLREAMRLGHCERLEGEFLEYYVHHDGKSGVMISLDAEPKSELNVAKDLCMHALFSKPLSIDRSGVPAADVEKVRRQAIDFATGEGKPESIVEKIADGKVNAFYSERVLLEQLHIKTDDYGKKKVGDILKDAGVKTVNNVVVMVVGM